MSTTKALDTSNQMRRLMEAAADPADRLVRAFYRLKDQPWFGHVDVALEAVDGATVEIENIFSKLQRKGYGRQAMQAICDLADQLGVQLDLQVKPQGIPYAKLVAFYRHFGFAPDATTKGVWMVRSPVATPPADGDTR